MGKSQSLPNIKNGDDFLDIGLEIIFNLIILLIISSVMGISALIIQIPPLKRWAMKGYEDSDNKYEKDDYIDY